MEDSFRQVLLYSKLKRTTQSGAHIRSVQKTYNFHAITTTIFHVGFENHMQNDYGLHLDSLSCQTHGVC